MSLRSLKKSDTGHFESHAERLLAGEALLPNLELLTLTNDKVELLERE